MRRLLTATALGGALLLTGCAATTPAADLGPARDWLETVQQAASDGPGDAGSASLLVGTGHDSDSTDTASSARLAYPEGAHPALTRADAQCYGGGTVDVAVTVFTADGTEGDTASAEISCDEAVHEIELGGEPGSAVWIDARSDDPTYVYVLLIQGLTVGFD